MNIRIAVRKFAPFEGVLRSIDANDPVADITRDVQRDAVQVCKGGHA